MPTILDLAGAPIPGTVQGKSLLPIIRGRQRAIRDLAVTSHTYLQDAEVRCPTAVRTDDFLYIYGGDEWPSELYDLKKDPGERRNILPKRRDVACALHERYLAFLREVDCPKEWLEGREDCCPTPRSPLPRMKWL
jgi:arylsulfatase A-like enzyme